MVADRLIRLAIGVGVSAWMARYLGPGDFGSLNYAMAFVGLFAALASLGLQNIVVRDLVRRPQQQDELIASAFVLRLVGATLAIGLAFTVISLLRPDDPVARTLVLIMSVALLPQAVDLVDYRNQASMNARPIVLIRNAAFLVFSSIKIAIILNQGSILMFAVAFSAETIVVAIAFMVYARASGWAIRLRSASRAECLRLLKEIWPLILAGVSVTIYMRIDQIMLGEMLNDEAVGLFAAAVRISEIWYFMPAAVMAAAAPVLTRLHRESPQLYQDKTLSVIRLLVWTGIAAGFLFLVLSRFLVAWLYGPSYLGSADVLVIHGWTGVFVGLNAVSAYWLVNAGRLKLTMLQTLAGAGVNVVLNLVLIPEFGIVGAASATIVSQAVSSLFLNYLFGATRDLFRLQIRAFLPFSRQAGR